jgi:uncharacterized protein YndB with AHSA1/START domain
MMPSAERTITVDRAPAEVFAFFTDPANDQTWRPAVKEMTAAGAPAVGARIRQVVKGPGGRGIAADIEITAYEPVTRYAFRVVAGPVRPVGEYTFTPNRTATDVRFHLTAELGGIKKLFMTKSVQKSIDGEMAALDAAKRAIEAST